MAFKRRGPFKSGLYRRNVKGRFNKGRRMRRGKGMTRRSADKVHQFARVMGTSFTTGTTTQICAPLVIAASSVGQGYVITPALQDTVAYTELTALYDQYRIWKVEFEFRLLNNPNAIANADPSGSLTVSAATVNAVNWYPSIWIVPDHDDSSTPALTDIKQYARAKRFTLRPNSAVKYSFRPNVLGQLYDGAITTAYKVEKPGQVWVDCSQATIPHYGLKFFVDFDGYTIPQPVAIEITAKYRIAMKCIR